MPRQTSMTVCSDLCFLTSTPCLGFLWCKSFRMGGRCALGHLHNGPAGPCKSMWFLTKHLICKQEFSMHELEGGGNEVEENTDEGFEGCWGWSAVYPWCHIYHPPHLCMYTYLPSPCLFHCGLQVQNAFWQTMTWLLWIQCFNFF